MQKFVHLVDLVKNFQKFKRVFTCKILKSSSIQPRTGLSKFAKKSPKARKKVRINIGIWRSGRCAVGWVALCCQQRSSLSFLDLIGFFYHEKRTGSRFWNARTDRSRRVVNDTLFLALCQIAVIFSTRLSSGILPITGELDLASHFKFQERDSRRGHIRPSGVFVSDVALFFRCLRRLFV